MFFSLSTVLPSKNYLRWGLFMELLILGVAYFVSDDWAETFRLAARYSGRLSLLVFLLPFAFYLQYGTKEKETSSLFAGLRVFAILHAIHFGFLAANIILNAIPLVPVKLVGGALAYIMILVLPFFQHKIQKHSWILALYFLYVWVVMTVTYISRVKGDFEGSEPSALHYLALGVLGCFLLAYLRQLSRSILIKK